MSEQALLSGYDLSCGYAGHAVIAHVDVHVASDEIVAILGGSGSGKSTLLRTMGGLQRPLAGELHLFGQHLYTLHPDQRRTLLRRTGMLFQQDALFGSMSVLDNLMLPLRELTDLPEKLAREMARAKLALVGLSEFEGRMPSDLSGGQRKRVALARAAVLDPDLLFCDEPTAALDPITAANIDRAFLKFRDVLGVAIVAVTHDVESVKTIADRALVLARGGVCASGTIAELERSHDPDVYNFFHRVAPAEAQRGQAG